MTHYTLTIYREDDETPWIEVSTDPAHARPYLHLPGEYDVGDVDLLRGRALVGEMLVRVIDPQTGADQSERWLTERLGVPQTEEGAGHSAVNGRRARLVEGSAVVLDGMVSGVRLSQSFAGFEFNLRDIRERHRKRSLFTRTGTATVLPRGVLDGYGQLPGGGWLVPPTRPLAATWRQESPLLGGSGYFDLTSYWQGGGGGSIPHRSGATVPPELVLTDAMREAAVRDDQGRYPHLAVLWRPLVGGAWRRIGRPGGGGSLFTREVLNAYPARLRGAGERDGEEVQAVGYIGCSRLLFQDPLPSDGQNVQVVVLYAGPPSEEYPFHWEGEAGDFLARVYAGEWSEGGRPVTERVDEAALARLTTPIRVRLTEPVEDSRAWIEEVYHQLRAAPALDAEGRIAPVTSELPGPDVVLPEITDDVCQPIPGWDHPATDAVTVVRVTYPRDVRVPAEDDPTGERSAGDGIASREITVESRAAEWALDLMGEQVHEIRATLFRALGGVDGSPISGDVSDETGHALAVQAGAEILDRWVFGGQSSFVALRRDAFPALRPGAWLIDRRSWRPNYREGRRGGQTLVQAMSVRVLDPAWLAVRLVDAGPAEQPLATPQLGTITVDDDGVVTIPVTLIPAGGEAAVYYYVGASAPSDPGQWRLVDRVGETGEVSTPPLPGGSTVWITARGEAEGRRPSDYRAPVSVQTPAIPRILEARATLDGPDPAITGAANAATQGVRVRYAVHDDGTEPPAPLPESADYPAADLATGLALPATVAPGQRLTAEVEGWTGYSGGSVTGQPGPAVLVTVARPVEPLDAERPTAAIELHSETATHETLRFTGALGQGGRVPLAYQYAVEGVTDWSAWAPMPDGEIVTDGQAGRPSPIARSERTRTVLLRVRDADGRESQVASYALSSEPPDLPEDLGRDIRVVPRWQAGPSAATLELLLDYGSEVRSIRVHYIDPVSLQEVSYTHDPPSADRNAVYAVLDAALNVRLWPYGESAPTITVTPYTQTGGGGTAGIARRVQPGTPDAPGVEIADEDQSTVLRGDRILVQSPQSLGLEVVVGPGGRPLIRVAGQADPSQGGTGLGGPLAPGQVLIGAEPGPGNVGRFLDASDIRSGTFGLARLPVAQSGQSSASHVVRADDARLSDARPPTAHGLDSPAHTGSLPFSKVSGGTGATNRLLIGGPNGVIEAFGSADAEGLALLSGPGGTGRPYWGAIPGTLPPSPGAGRILISGISGAAWSTSGAIPQGAILIGSGEGAVTAQFGPAGSVLRADQGGRWEPHHLTASDVGALPITGGTVTGPTTLASGAFAGVVRSRSGQQNVVIGYEGSGSTQYLGFDTAGGFLGAVDSVAGIGTSAWRIYTTSGEARFGDIQSSGSVSIDGALTVGGQVTAGSFRVA